MTVNTEWTTEELWKQEQLNFTGHMAIMFEYLQKHGLSVDDFVRFTADKVIPGWQKKGRGKTVEDLMSGILFNVAANGGEVLETKINDEEVTAKVSHLLHPEIMEAYGSPPEMTERFWDKFILIAEALGMGFTWERTEDHLYHIRVNKSGS
jgi:hypothetical protein